MFDKQDVVRTYQTLVEMMGDRGIDTGIMERFQSEELAAIASVQPVFVVPIRRVTADGAVLPNDANDKEMAASTIVMQIIYNLNPKVKYSDLKKIVETFVHDVPHTIMVFKEPLTSQNAKAIHDAVAQGLRIETFEVKELLFNVSRHELVPKHEKMHNEDDVKALLQSLKIKSKTQLPIILKTDPMARYLGLKTGDVVKVTRPSPTSGTYVHYRCCV